MIEIRNTPRSTGKSPAELLYHRSMRSHVPTVPPSPSPLAHQVEPRRERQRQRAKDLYDRTAQPLPELQVGQRVLVQDEKTHLWTHRGTIVSKGPHRDYKVNVGRRRLMHRNRKFIRLCNDNAET